VITGNRVLERGRFSEVEASQGSSARVRPLPATWIALAVIVVAVEWAFLILVGFGTVPYFNSWRMQAISEIAATGVVWGVCIFIVIGARQRKRR
jgi:hypothetical protein